MNRRLALIVIATLSLLSLAIAATASASSLLTVSVEAPASQYAAGSDAVFRVTATGDDASGVSLDFSVEGGSITGVVSLNETAPGVAEGAVHVHRDTPGLATLILSLGGTELARGSAEFVSGQRLTVDVQLEADPSAAARTWYFDIFDAAGVNVAFVRVGTSGDRPTASAGTQPLPFGRYTVKPALGRDAAENCAGTAFYAMTAAAGVDVELGPSGGSAGFTVRPCPRLPRDLDVSAPVDAIEALGSQTGAGIDDVAGVRTTAPLPPATGNGQAEKPTLPDSHARQLFGLLLGTVIAFGIGIVVVRVLVRVAPVKTKK